MVVTRNTSRSAAISLSDSIVVRQPASGRAVTNLRSQRARAESGSSAAIVNRSGS